MRYLALATVLVVAVLVILTNLPHAPRPASGDPRFSSSTASPGPAQNDDHLLETPPPLGGEAPWALSALPECFHVVSHRSGTPAFARSGFPRGAKPVGAGKRLRVADCTLDVGADSALVVRGENRFVVPPLSRFYVSGRHVILDRSDDGRVDVRVYALHADALPQFVPSGARQPLRRRAQSQI
jgi:hypothetical protein